MTKDLRIARNELNMSDNVTDPATTTTATTTATTTTTTSPTTTTTPAVVGNSNTATTTAAAATTTTTTSTTSRNAFEWLSGGLFFGNNNNNNNAATTTIQRVVTNNKKVLQAIESCKDVKSLWIGVDENLEQIAVAAHDYNDNEQQQQDHNNNNNDNLDLLLSARLIRLRCLLYEERKITASGGGGGGGSSATTTFRLTTSTTTALPQVAVTTVQYFIQKPHLLTNILKTWTLVAFESRKVVTHLICYLLLAGLDGHDAEFYLHSVTNPFVQGVILTQFSLVMDALLTCLNNTMTTAIDIALHCGTIYRSLLRHVLFYQYLVDNSDHVQAYVFPFLDTHVHSPNFDIASDAMECLRLILAPPSPEMAEFAADFMTRDYVPLWEERFVPKLLSISQTQDNSYMVQRVALQIVSTILLTRANYNIMVRFVASAHNLKVVLLLLRHTSPHISLDAFHVFKVFVANPHKPPQVVKILKDNQVKLSAYLKTLHVDKANNDAQFREEKNLIISTIDAL